MKNDKVWVGVVVMEKQYQDLLYNQRGIKWFFVFDKYFDDVVIYEDEEDWRSIILAR